VGGGGSSAGPSREHVKTRESPPFTVHQGRGQPSYWRKGGGLAREGGGGEGTKNHKGEGRKREKIDSEISTQQRDSSDQKEKGKKSL